MGDEPSGASCWANVLGSSIYLGEVPNPGPGPVGGPPSGPPASIPDFIACNKCNAKVIAAGYDDPYPDDDTFQDGQTVSYVRQFTPGFNGREIRPCGVWDW